MAIGAPSAFLRFRGFFRGVPDFLGVIRVFGGCSWFFGCSEMFRDVPVFRVPVFLEVLHAGCIVSAHKIKFWRQSRQASGRIGGETSKYRSISRGFVARLWQLHCQNFISRTPYHQLRGLILALLLVKNRAIFCKIWH